MREQMDVLAETAEGHYAVEGCSSLAEARERLSSPWSPPLALFVGPPLDIDQAGDAEVIALLRREHPMALCLALVNGVGRETAARALVSEHCDRVLEKTEDRVVLTEAVRALLSAYESRRLVHDLCNGGIGHRLFVTGATGFLGKVLIREILRCTTAEVVALCRGSQEARFDQRLPYTEEDFPGRLRFVEGDVVQPGLGLTPEVQDELASSIDEIWHLAAITSFSSSLRERIMSVNVGGLEAMLTFARRCKKLRCFNHVSTAYVVGRREQPQLVPEAIIEPPSSFKNPYEESKYLCERLVADSGIPHIVYRPSVVMGESYSGRCDDKTVYAVARAFKLAKASVKRHADENECEPDFSFRVAGNEEASINLIPVDWVVDAFLRIRAQAEGGIFHVTHPIPTRIRDLHRRISEALGVPPVVMIPGLERMELRPAERLLSRQIRDFAEYMSDSDPDFDCTNTRTTLNDYHLPELDVRLLAFSFQSFFQRQELQTRGLIA